MVSCCLSATGICFLGILFPLGIQLSSRSAYQAAIKSTWTLTGFPRSTRTRFDRGGCPLYPGTVVLSRLADVLQPAPAAFSSGQSYTPQTDPICSEVDDNGTSPRVYVLHPSGLPLACGPRMGRGPLGFTLGFGPRGYPRRPPGQGRALSTGSELHLRHQPTLQSDAFTCVVRPRVADIVRPRSAGAALRALHVDTSHTPRTAAGTEERAHPDPG